MCLKNHEYLLLPFLYRRFPANGVKHYTYYIVLSFVLFHTSDILESYTESHAKERVRLIITVYARVRFSNYTDVFDLSTGIAYM